MNPLTVEILRSLDRVGSPTVAGSTIVVPVTSYDIDENDDTTVLYRVDHDGLTPLTSNTVSSTSPSLSPDGSQLAFLRKVEGKSKGVDARLVYFPDENHWILKPQNSLYWHEEVLGWLNRYLEEWKWSYARSARKSILSFT
jgi:dipeptidyl aminopeptidase/acylaminoacyl peptidase